MAGRKKAAWRAPFLRALRRTGNVRAAAAEAGIDPGTAYDHRIKDPGFAGAWAKAVDRARSAPSRRAARAKGEVLIARRSKRHGVQMVRAGPGRWSPAAEARFFAALGRTACVRREAEAAGVSTTALYKRRSAYPEFAERWREVEEKACERIPALLAAATIASLDPAEEAGRINRLPRVNIDQAIAISRLKGGAVKGSGSGGRGVSERPRSATRAELIEAITRQLDVLRRRREVAAAGHRPGEGRES